MADGKCEVCGKDETEVAVVSFDAGAFSTYAEGRLCHSCVRRAYQAVFASLSFADLVRGIIGEHRDGK